MAPTVTYWLLRLILKTNGIRQLIVFIDKLISNNLYVYHNIWTLQCHHPFLTKNL